MRDSTWNMMIENEIRIVEGFISEHGEMTTLAQLLEELEEALIDDIGTSETK